MVFAVKRAHRKPWPPTRVGDIDRRAQGDSYRSELPTASPQCLALTVQVG